MNTVEEKGKKEEKNFWQTYKVVKYLICEMP